MSTDLADSIWKMTLAEILASSAKSKPDLTGGSLIVCNASVALALVLLPLEVSKRRVKDDQEREQYEVKIRELKNIHEKLLVGAGHDLKVFDRVRKLPKEVSKEEKERVKQVALIKAIESPLHLGVLILASLKIVREVFYFCKKSVISDLGAAGFLLSANLKSILLLAESNINSLTAAKRIDFQRQKRELQDAGLQLENEIGKLLKRYSAKIKT